MRHTLPFLVAQRTVRALCAAPAAAPAPSPAASSASVRFGALYKSLHKSRAAQQQSAAAAAASPPKPASGSGAPAPAAPPAPASCRDDTGPVEGRPLSALQRRQVRMKDKKVFALTGRAVDRVRLLLDMHNSRLPAGAAEAGRAVGIRVGVKKRGCSGYSYTVNYAADPRYLAIPTGGDALVTALAAGGPASRRPAQAAPGSGADFAPDVIHVEQDGVHVFVESQALFYVIGTMMDFSVTNVEEKFIFQNPNQEHSCGCGESFMPFGA